MCLCLSLSIPIYKMEVKNPFFSVFAYCCGVRLIDFTAFLVDIIVSQRAGMTVDPQGVCQRVVAEMDPDFRERITAPGVGGDGDQTAVKDIASVLDFFGILGVNEPGRKFDHRGFLHISRGLI